MVEPGQQGIREREAKVPASRAHPNYQDLPETLSSLLRDQDADPPTAPGYDPEDRRRTSRLRRRRRTPIKPRGTARLPTPKPSSPSHKRGRACHTKSIVHHGSERRESIALIHWHGTATGPLQPEPPGVSALQLVSCSGSTLPERGIEDLRSPYLRVLGPHHRVVVRASQQYLFANVEDLHHHVAGLLGDERVAAWEEALLGPYQRDRTIHAAHLFGRGAGRRYRRAILFRRRAGGFGIVAAIDLPEIVEVVVREVGRQVFHRQAPIREPEIQVRLGALEGHVQAPEGPREALLQRRLCFFFFGHLPGRT